jgi:hypothetical protein
MSTSYLDRSGKRGIIGRLFGSSSSRVCNDSRSLYLCSQGAAKHTIESEIHTHARTHTHKDTHMEREGERDR